MSLDCGTLQRVVAEGKPDALKGEIDVAGVIGGFIFLIENTNKRSENSPDWKVKFRAGHAGKYAELGSAWNNETRTGEPCIGIVIDGPRLAKKVDLTAFVSDDQPKDDDPDAPTNWVLRWYRQDASRKPEMAGGDPAEFDDEIPY